MTPQEKKIILIDVKNNDVFETGIQEGIKFERQRIREEVEKMSSYDMDAYDMDESDNMYLIKSEVLELLEKGIWEQ